MIELSEVLAARDLRQGVREEVATRSLGFAGAREEKRFATWHRAWLHLDRSERSRMLEVLAAPEAVRLSGDQIDQARWSSPSGGHRLHPDAVISVPERGGWRTWAVLEYKLGAQLNWPARETVAGVADSESLPPSMDGMDAHAFRWLDPKYYGEYRVSQLAAYYFARDRVLGPGATDDRTLWRIVAPARWSLKDWQLSERAVAKDGSRVVPLAPEEWQRTDVVDLLELFISALARTNPATNAEDAAGLPEAGRRHALLDAVAAMTAGPGTRPWRARVAASGETRAFASCDPAVRWGCGLWDGCFEALWLEEPGRGEGPAIEVQLHPGWGYVLVPHDAGAPGETLAGELLAIRLDEAQQIRSALGAAGQRLSGEPCPLHGADCTLDCIDDTGATLHSLRDRRSLNRCVEVSTPRPLPARAE